MGGNYSYAWTFLIGDPPAGAGDVIEDAAYIVKGGGVIVLPTSGQIYSHRDKIIKDGMRTNHFNRSRVDYIPWETKNSKFYVYLNDTEYEVLAVIHTHPSSGSYELSTGMSGDESLIRKFSGIRASFAFGEQGVGMGQIVNGVFKQGYVGSFESLMNGTLNLTTLTPK